MELEHTVLLISTLLILFGQPVLRVILHDQSLSAQVLRIADLGRERAATALNQKEEGFAVLIVNLVEMLVPLELVAAALVLFGPDQVPVEGGILACEAHVLDAGFDLALWEFVLQLQWGYHLELRACHGSE